MRFLVVEMMAMAGSLGLALDIYAHKRVEMLGGVNIWGYRGTVAHHRQLNEIRVAVFGGTRAFAWGQPASALASEIRRLIMLTTDRRGAELRPVVVINVARLGALPDSYPATIDHFSYLKPDYICLYDDLGVPGAASADGTSGVFELTGYAPVLPLVLREKGMIWRYGDVKRGYASAESRHVETTSLLRRVAGSTLEAVGAGMSAADRSIARMTLPVRREAPAHDSGAGGYANAMMTAVDVAHRYARGVVVAVSPAETAEQIRNLRALERRMDGATLSAPWIRFVDLGARTELYDNALRLDGWNYGGAGIALVAGQLAPALLSLIAER